MKIIGIDPGLNGAIAILEDNKVLDEMIRVKAKNGTIIFVIQNRNN